MRAMLCALIIVGAIAAVSCDERNEADLPLVVYSLKKNIVTPGVALYVDAKDDMLAVAASSAGTYVYNITDAVNPTEVFHYEQVGRLYSAIVGIDPVNKLVVTSSEPVGEPGNKYPIHLYERTEDAFIGGLAFSAPVDLRIVSIEGELNVWRTDNTDGLQYDSYCYNADSLRWRPDYCTDFFTGFDAPGTFRLRSFGISDDNIAAVAQVNYEIRLHDIVTGASHARFSTSGDPQDCAWRGNYLLVADYLHFTVVDAANVDSPVVAKTLTIPGADRLVRVVTDGNYAILLDDVDGIYIVDISTPTDPKFVQSISLPEPSGVTATNGKIIASDEQLGVLIYQR